MQLRKLVLACGFASFALSNYASALGLGEVKLNSKLNQPLSAEIKLLEVQDLTAEQILIALASPADFERNGVDRLYFYTEFQFSVELQHAGGPVVRITSRNPVREPYLNFLIEARWSAGRLLREYTVLMDLPTFDSTPPQAVQAPAAAKPKVTEVPKPRPIPTPAVSEVAETPAAVAVPETKRAEAVEPEPAKKKSKISSGTYGPIDGKDTLWEIARDVRPDSSVSVHQTMIALQRLNPDAFIRGNINLLKKGQVLRVPDVSDAAAVDRSEAVDQVANQNNKWSTPGADADTDMGAQLDASRSTAVAPKQAEPIAGRVKLEAPVGAEDGAAGQASGSDKAGGKGVEAKLSASLEELDKAKSENSELTSRVHELEERLKTMQRLVDVSNEKMSALQLSAAKQAEISAALESAADAPVETPAAEVAATEAVEPSAEASSAAAVEPSAEVASAAAAPAADDQAAAASSQAAAKALAKSKPEKTFVETLSDNVLWVALGAVGIAGAGLVYMRRRKDDDADAGDFPEAQSFYVPEPTPAFDSYRAAPQPQTDTQFTREEPIPDDEDTTVVAETDDVVSEAGIYITLGKYSQAEDMLLNALNSDTVSSGVYIKLLEVYAHNQNVAEFDKHYAALWPIGSPFELHRASELRASIVDAGVFHGTDVALNQLVTDDHVPVDENIDVTVRRYDLDSTSKAVSTNDVSTIQLGDELELDNRIHPDAEDLSDISLALDGLEEHKEEIIAEDIEVATLEDDAVGGDEEISFDFNELEAEPADFTLKDTVNDLKFPDDEDFNLEMEMGDVDLAALDREMDHLDAGVAVKPAPGVAVEEKDDDLAGFDALFTEEDLPAEQPQPVAPPQPAKANAEAVIAIADNDAIEYSAEPVALEVDDELTLPESDSDLANDQFDSEVLARNDQHLELPEDDDLTLVEASDKSAETILAEASAVADKQTEVAGEPAPPSEILALDNADNASLSDLDKELQSLGGDTFAVKAPLVEIDSDDDIDEEVFNLALSDFSAESLDAEAEAEDLAAADQEGELDFIVDADEAATKLDLARAYLDMGDNEGARDILAEVAQEGNEQQREEAIGLLSRIDA